MTPMCNACGHSLESHGFSPSRACVNEPCYSCPRGGWVDRLDFTDRAIATVEGVGPDAPVVANAAGGKQSHSPYRADLLPPLALLAVAKVLKHGADKYGANNWHAIPVADHVNHALVHLLALNAGDVSDEHLEHAATRILFALDSKIAGRPAEGGV